VRRRPRVPYATRFRSVLRWDDWLAAQEAWTQPPLPAPSSMMYTSGTTGRPKGVRRQPWTPEQRAVYNRVNAPVIGFRPGMRTVRSEGHTSELQSRENL